MIRSAHATNNEWQYSINVAQSIHNLNVLKYLNWSIFRDFEKMLYNTIWITVQILGAYNFILLIFR